MNFFDILKRYDLKFVSDVPDNLRCTICKKVLIDSCNIPCGCRFCYNCISEYLSLKDNEKCPGIKEDCKELSLNFSNHVIRDSPANVDVSYLFVNCPFPTCEHEIQLRRLSEHMRVCLKAPVDCVFSAVGCCIDTLLGENMKEHLSEHIVSHGNMLVSSIKNMENETNRRMESQEMNFNDLKEELLKVKEELRKSREEITALQQRLEGYEQQQTEECARIDKIEDSISIKNYFSWNIEQIDNKCTAGSYAYSQPFYSDVNNEGYKLCLYFQMQKTSYLYVTFFLMKGDNDDRIQWPMTRTVQLEIINQDTSLPTLVRQFCLGTVTERGVTPASYSRPTADRNGNYDGFYNTMTYTQIMGIAGLIKDDTMCVRCRVLPQ